MNQTLSQQVANWDCLAINNMGLAIMHIYTSKSSKTLRSHSSSSMTLELCRQRGDCRCIRFFLMRTESKIKGCRLAPLFHSLSQKVAKRWPRLGYKRKKILRFRSFWVICKISLVPGTGLEPALLSEHAPETCASTNSATRAGSIPSVWNESFWLCPGQDLNLHRLWRLPPQSSVSTNSTTWALFPFRKRMQK